MASMDSHVTKGKSDVTDKLTKAKDDVRKIGDEFQDTKNGLSGMPGGLDSDIVSMIESAIDRGRSEAEADIESIKSSDVATAKASADTIKSDVTQKISDNTTAKGKLEGIRSKYGRSEILNASKALDQNSKIGNDLMKDLDNAMRDADQAIEGIKGSL